MTTSLPQITPQLHPNIKDIEVSVYNSGSDAASKRYLRLQEIVDIIITGRPLLSNPQRSIKNLQEELRYRQKDLSQKEYQKWKTENLPMFLVTGCFEHRNNTGLIGPHTSLINIDIDHMKDVGTLKDSIIANEPALILAGISPGGDGIKLVFQVTPTPTDAAEHKIIANQLQDYLAKRYKIPITDTRGTTGIDCNGVSLTFTCFFFHDTNLYVNTNVPSKFQGNLQVSNAKNNEQNNKTDEIFDWTKLDSCLEFYTADCGYHDWTDIGMALKHEGTRREKEELFYQKWFEWSSKSTSKFDASKMSEKWDTFNNENDQQITLGTIYFRAHDIGWNPPVTSITAETEANRKSIQQKELEQYAIEQKMPMHLRPIPAESTDLARLLHYHSDKFIVINDSRIHIQTRRGAWEEVEIEQSNGKIDNILRLARQTALEEALHHKDGGQEYRDRLDKSFRDSNSHIKALTGRLLSIIENQEAAINIVSIQDKEFNNRTTTHPTLPLKDGAIDLATNEVLTAEQYAKYHQLHIERWAAEYDPNILNADTPGVKIAKHLIYNHYGEELFSRIALHLVRPSKSVDIINMPVSSSGKTALAEWLKSAVGSVEIDSRSRSLTPRGDAYSAGTAPLTEYLIYFYDEVDKLGDDIPVGMLNEMTGENLTIGKKFQNASPRTRIGTPILMGAYWPPIDATAQGIDTRINFVYKRNNEPMATDTKLNLINDTDTHKYLLAWIVAEAHKHYNSDKEWQNSPDSDIARLEFIEARTPEIKKLLTETYEQSNTSNDYVTVAHINDTLSSLTNKPRNVSDVLNEVFPRVRKDKKRIKVDESSAITKPMHVYLNLRIKIEPLEDEELTTQTTVLHENMEKELESLLEHENPALS